MSSSSISARLITSLIAAILICVLVVLSDMGRELFIQNRGSLRPLEVYLFDPGIYTSFVFGGLAVFALLSFKVKDFAKWLLLFFTLFVLIGLLPTFWRFFIDASHPALGMVEGPNEAATLFTFIIFTYLVETIIFASICWAIANPVHNRIWASD